MAPFLNVGLPEIKEFHKSREKLVAATYCGVLDYYLARNIIRKLC
jgi:hypothetical protein